MGRNLRHRAHGGGEVLLGDGGGGIGLGTKTASASDFSSGATSELASSAPIFIFSTVLLLLDAQDIGRAFDAGEQILAVVGVEEFAERLDAADDHQEIVLASSAKTASTRSCRAPCVRNWNFSQPGNLRIALEREEGTYENQP